MKLAHESKKIINEKRNAKDASWNIYYDITCAHEGKKWIDGEEKDE